MYCCFGVEVNNSLNTTAKSTIATGAYTVYTLAYQRLLLTCFFGFSLFNTQCFFRWHTTL